MMQYHSLRPDIELVSADEFISHNNDVPTKGVCSNEDIVTSLKKGVDQHESSDDKDLPPPSIAQAKSAMNTFMRFVDSSGSADQMTSNHQLTLANSLQH